MQDKLSQLQEKNKILEKNEKIKENQQLKQQLLHLQKIEQQQIQKLQKFQQKQENTITNSFLAFKQNNQLNQQILNQSPMKNLQSSNYQIEKIKLSSSQYQQNDKKKWKKTDEKEKKQKSDNISKGDQNQLNEQSIIELCENTWSSFLEGEKYSQYQQEQSLNLFGHNNRELEQKIAQQNDINDKIINSKHFKNEIDTKIKNEKINNLKKLNYDSTAIEFFKKYKLDKVNDEEFAENEYDNTNLRRMDVDDKYLDEDQRKEKEREKKKNKKEQKYEERQEKREKKKDKKESNKTDKILQSCKFCLANETIQQEQIISLGTQSLMIMPKYQVYDEMRNFMKCLVACFDQKDQDVIFIENATKLNDIPHCIIECIVLPRKMQSQSELYFRKSIDELDGEWSVHKKRIDISREKGGIMKQIPQNFPYFYVDFGLSYGYAHVIENEAEFSKNFAHEIIATIMKLELPNVLNPKKLDKNEIFDKKIKFQKVWEPYDWTKMI
ncbi:hypothetical protein PPERSA_11439 [Pseudocohnilembus persalinus]|uniref:Uncharacterized protein n=1 Tax=Pseudocohnilembus persalinus TaxID=266149 RepID=A0A0V0QXK6_PSEPJ|nr:hypothetical protein PPERSA_11439 [Pseudocohnilembus persalinus]|eukprot:KRX06794.1 hypothetical protein PPERSA_11439 [Pseudocohnilembus persalinus]